VRQEGETKVEGSCVQKKENFKLKVTTKAEYMSTKA